MRKTKKTLSVILAALMLALTCMTYVPAGAAEVSSAAPEIAFLGIEHSPLVEGQKESFFLTAKNADKVLYSAVLKDETGKEIENLTKGWTTEEPGNIPFEIKSSTEFKAGKYKLVVDAKRASDGKTLVKPYTADLNCIPKDSNYIDVRGNANTDKDEYTVGEKITVAGIQGISEKIEGPYMYKLHVYNASTGIWAKNAIAEYGDKIEWTPGTPGTYILDIYVNSKKSTTWAKYDENHASEDTAGTYEAWKLVTVNVIEAPKVTNIAAINKKTIKVSYNMELGKVQVPNFEVNDKEDQYSLKTIKSVSVNKNVVTINLDDSLVNAGEYTLTSTNISNVDNTRTLESSKDNFAYTEIDTPASIEFASSTVAMGDTVKYVIRDKDGNDITPNIIDGADDSDGNIIIETSNSNTVNNSLVAQSVGVAVVNLSIENTAIATGNTIIKVVTTLKKPTTIGRVTVVSYAAAEPDYTTKIPTLYVGGASNYIKFEAFDQNGDEMEWDEASNKTTPPDAGKVRKRFRSSSPNVVVVDEGTGKITPVAAGNATIIVTATDAYGNTVSKSIDVTAKEAQVFTSLDIPQTSYDVVIGSPIPITLNVYALDQNGDYIQSALFGQPIYYTINKVQNIGSFFTTGKNFVYIQPDSEITTPKSVKVTITSGTEKKNITLNYISKGEFTGYKLSAYDIYSISMFPSLLDKNDYEIDLGENSIMGDTTYINIFKSDSDGNVIGSEFKYDEYGGVIDYGTHNITLETQSKGIVKTNVDDMSVTGLKIGSEIVTVKMGTLTIGKITFNVVNKDPAPKTLEIVNNVVTVSKGDKNVFAALFGTDEKGAAFIAYDQEGNKIQVKPGDVKIYSSNKEVINNNLEAGSKAGTALLIIIVEDKTYTVTVKVQ